MHLGALISRLENEADAMRALEALGDLALFAEVQEVGAQHDEAPGEYLANAAQRFAAAASDDDWLTLMGAMERTDDPASVAIDKMLRWALVKDRAEATDPPAQSHCGCGSGGGGCGGHA